MSKHRVRVSCRAIIRKEDSLFLVKQKHLERENEVNDFWCTIGGGLDPGESLIDNLKREIEEEVGVVNVEVGRLLYIQQFEGYGLEHIEFFFEILNVDDFKSIDLRKTTHGLIEIESFAFINPKEEHCLPELLSVVIDDLDNSDTQFPILKNYL